MAFWDNVKKGKMYCWLAPKSDALSPKDLVAMSPICSKCGNKMERRSVDKFSLTNLFNIFKNYTRR